MRKIPDECKRCDIFVLVDETYVEFAPDSAAIDSIPLTQYYNNLVILRGISKFFAALGLRLGYAITGNEKLLEQINARKNPWTINSLAAVAGELMFSDTEYIAKTKALINRERVFQEMESWRTVKLYPSSANFVLAKILKEDVTDDDLFDHAIRQKLMIRNCSTSPFLDQRYFRFCFMSPEKTRSFWIACMSFCERSPRMLIRRTLSFPDGTLLLFTFYSVRLPPPGFLSWSGTSSYFCSRYP